MKLLKKNSAKSVKSVSVKLLRLVLLIWTRFHIALVIMYNSSEFLLVPAKNKMYEGAALVHLIFAGTS